MTDLITLGIGPGGDIPHFLTFGLDIGAAPAIWTDQAPTAGTWTDQSAGADTWTDQSVNSGVWTDQ